MAQDPVVQPGEHCPCGKPLPWDVLSGFDGIQTHSEMTHLCDGCGRRFKAAQGQVTITEDHCTLCEGERFLYYDAGTTKVSCPRCNLDGGC